MSQPYNLKRLGTDVVSIVVALIAGIIIDQIFEKHFVKRKHIFPRIVLQFLVIIAVVVLFNVWDPPVLPSNIVSNVFFMAVFLGVQQGLFAEVGRVQLYPKIEIKPKKQSYLLCFFR